MPADEINASEREFRVDASPLDGTLAIDLMDSIWTLSADGGSALQLTDGLTSASHPRWSPDGRHILYQLRTHAGGKVWQIEITSGKQEQIIDTPFHVQDASWHPQGERVVYASEQSSNGLDVWEIDLSTGLSWRLTSDDGDEIEPAWSANGHHLAYIRRINGRHFLMLRRKGEQDVELLSSATPLSSPSWRPDGSVLTFLRHNGNQWILQMAILSAPALIRTVSDSENFFSSPVSWIDRMQMVYTADGQIRTLGFGARRSRPLTFRAVVDNLAVRTPRIAAKRELDIVNAPDGALIVRGRRLFDGIWSRYREQMDVRIEGGKITAIERRHDWADTTILDLGSATIMPGLIDSWSALPASLNVADGAALLAYGVTTLVSPDNALSFDTTLWESESMPGPRVLPAGNTADGKYDDASASHYLARYQAEEHSLSRVQTGVAEWHRRGIPVVVDSWSTGRKIGANVFLGATSLPTGRQRVISEEPFTLISGLADAGTPGMNALLRSRQPLAFGHTARPSRRLSRVPELETIAASVVAGSRPNGLPPGIALHAELYALTSAGLSGEQVLHAAGRNAAVLLGLENQIGTITPGAMADMLLVSGDPLSRSGDAMKIVAVVRNGRFFSLVSLLELSDPNTGVE